MRTQALLLAASLVSQPVGAADEATSFTIAGRVVDTRAEPEPVAGAEIIALSLPPERATRGAEMDALRASRDWQPGGPGEYEVGRMTTGEDGAFELTVEPVAGEGLHLVVRAFGWRSIYRRLSDPARSEEPLGPLALTLAPGARLEGRVVSLLGEEAIARAELKPWRRHVKTDPGLAILELLYPKASTDDHGDWEIDGLPPGTYSVNARADAHFWKRSGEVAVAAGEVRRVDLALAAARAITGRVTDAAGEPVADATVTFEYSRPPTEPSFARAMRQAMARTEEDGRYRLDAVLPEQAGKLVVRHPEHAPAEIEAAAGPVGEGDPIDVVLVSGGVYAGVLVDGRERPIGGAAVLLIPKAELDELRRRGRGREIASRWMPRPSRRGEPLPGATDKSGGFRLDAAPVGEHVVAVFAFGKVRITEAVVYIDAGQALTEQWLQLELGAAVTGVVLDPAGQPLAGAQVALFCRAAATPELARLETKADGGFEFRGVAGSDCRLSAHFRGHARIRRDLAEPTGHHELMFEAYGAIAGRVTFADGGAASTVDIALYPAEVSADRMRRGSSGGSGSVPAEDGRYRYDRVTSGEWDVELSAPGYQPVRVEDVEVAADATTEGVDARLERGAEVNGRVVRASDGSALIDARVSIKDEPFFRMMPGMDSEGVATDLDGRFHLAGLRPGRTTLAVRHGDFPPHFEEVEVRTERPTEVRIALRAGASVVGRVSGPDGSPVSGAEVEAAVSMRPRGRRAVTDADGAYRIDGLAEGAVDVELAVPTDLGSSTLVVSVEVREGEATEVDFSLGGTKLVGRVVREGSQVTAARIFARRARQRGSTWSASTGGDGRFELFGLEPGEYTFTIYDRSAGWGRSLSSEARVEIPDVEQYEHDFTLSEITITGQVVDADSGEPIAEASVRALGVEVDGRAPGHGMSRSDGEGRFTLSLASAGSFTVMAQQDGYAPGRPRTVAVTGAGLADLRLELGRGRELTGVVVDADGREVPHAFVLATPAGAAKTERTYTSTDEVGRFAIALSEEVTSRLVIGSQEHAPTIVDGVMATGEAIEFVLHRGGGLALAVAGHEPGATLTVELRDEALQVDLFQAAPRFGEAMSLLLRLSRAGEAVFEHIPAGRYTVEVTDGERTASGDVAIEEGATAKLALEL